MANNSGEFISILERGALKELKDLNTALTSTKDGVNAANGALKNFKIPSQSKQFLSDLNGILSQNNILLKQQITLQEKLNKLRNQPVSAPSNPNSTNPKTPNDPNNSKYLTEQERLIKRIADARREEAVETAKLRIELAGLNAENKKQAQEILNSFNSYQKLSGELNVLRLEAKGLATDMFLLAEAGETNTVQYAQLSEQYEKAALRVNTLDQGLKKIDSSLGQSQRNVGNYASGFNPLGNAIGQLARELPNLGQSFQIFAMSVGNNFGQLDDAIKGLVAQNKELIAQGKPTVSIFKQIASQVFSLNTLLYVGIAVFIAYGKEIGEWAKNLFGASDALEKVTENQTKLNAAQLEGQKAAVEDIVKLKENLNIAKDTALSMTERQIGLKKLRGEYAFYFKDLTDEQILAGDTKKAEDALTIAIEKRQEANRLSGVIVGNKQRIKEIDDELIGVNKLIKQRKADFESLKAVNSPRALEDRDRAGRRLLEIEQKGSELAKERNALNKQNESTQGTILTLRKESIGLDYQEEKAGKVKQLQYEKLVDFAASEYELNRTRLENEAAFQQEIYSNEENGYADREAAAAKYSEKIFKLAELRRDEELRLIDKTIADETAAYNKRVADEEITRKNANDAISAIEQQATFNRAKVYEDFSQGVIDATKEVDNALKGVWSNLSQQERQNSLDKQQIDNLRQIGLLYKNIGVDTDTSGFDKLENSLRRINESEEDAQVQELRNQKLAIQGDIDKLLLGGKAKENNEAILKLQQQQNQLENQALTIENKRLQAVKALREQMKGATDGFFNSIQQSFLGNLGLDSLSKFTDKVKYDVIESINGIDTLVQKTGSTFQMQLDQAATSSDKMKIAAVSGLEVFNQALSFMNQNQQAYFDAQFANAKREYDISVKFAGDSAIAKEELDREYEQRQREIRIRQAKAEKEQSIFKATIGIATAIIAALGNPFQIALVSALGALQLAAITSAPLPAYAEGTDFHPGGKAIVGDGGRHEVIKYPNGKMALTPNTDTIVDLPRGAKVYPDIYQSGVLGSNLPIIEKGSNMDGVIGAIQQLNSKWDNLATINNNIDANGFTSYMVKGNAKTIYSNNRRSGTGTVIRG